MSWTMFDFHGTSLSAQTSSRRPQPRFTPAFEALESREVPAAGVGALLHDVGHAAPAAAGQQAVLPIQITGVSINNGQLVATGQALGQTFTAPLTLSAQPGAQQGDPPILDLALQPIHLNLLGLNVQTSPICLDISAQPGPGNLLGNLLTDVTNLLNGGNPLGGILSGLTPTQTSTLTGGLTNLLGSAFNSLSSGLNGSVGSLQTTPGGVTNILNLSVGPLHLNLLGLNVNLDNCSGGPVTVDVYAQSGPGNLLGNLLTDVAGILDRLPTPLATRVVDTILGDISQLAAGV